MSDIAYGASVMTVENPDTDELTVAWSAYDYYVSREAELDVEIAKLTGKRDRMLAERHLAWAEQTDEAIAATEALREGRLADIAAAKALIDEIEEANPELAAYVRERREVARAQRIAELRAELDRLDPAPKSRKGK